MHQYHTALRQVISNGSWQQNRTGVKALSTPGLMMKFHLERDGFPAVTTKKLAFKAVKGELIGFMRGYTNAADFRALGCNIWDQNANENQQWLNNPNRKGEDDLGLIYGAMWRNAHGVDQLGNAIQTILKDPTNRRVIISAWIPDQFQYMSLPPCHVLYQFIVNVEKRELNLCMYQRSCDMFLGVPFNIASASLLLCLVARLTGYAPGEFTHFLADAHIYENHMDQVETLLSRTPMSPPSLYINGNITQLEDDASLEDIDKAIRDIEPDDIDLMFYESHPAIKAEMAV